MLLIYPIVWTRMCYCLLLASENQVMSIEVGYQGIPCPSYVNYMVATEFHLAGFLRIRWLGFLCSTAQNPMVGMIFPENKIPKEIFL